MGQEKKQHQGEFSGPKGIIFEIQRYAIDDGPGIRTTVFLKGCPLSCLWCHNPEGMNMDPELAWHEKYCTHCLKCVEACPLSAIQSINSRLVTDRTRCNLCGTCVRVCPASAREIVGRIMTVDELFAELYEDRAFYQESQGGITCSGGEPLHQAGFVEALFRKCRENGIHTALDTSGYSDWDSFAKVLAFTDLVLFDLKSMDRSKHLALTGVDPTLIWENFNRLATKGIPIWVRCPVIPGLIDDQENFRKVAEFASKFDTVKKIELLPYHRLGEPKYKMLNKEFSLWGTEPPDAQTMRCLRNTAAAITSGKE